MGSLNEYRLELLKQEIDLINQKINHFDILRNRTKQMAITLWIAAVGFSLTKNEHLILNLSIIIPIPFWIQESYYHAYQEGFISRFWAITEFLRDGRYLVKDNEEAFLSKHFENEEGSFPIPDYYGNKTIKDEEFKKNDSALQNFKKAKMIIFYLPLVLCSVFAKFFID